MVGRAVDQLRREGFLAGTRFASFHSTLAALRDAAAARAAKNENHFSSVTVALRPADIPAVQAGAVGPGAGSVTRGEVVQMLAASEQKMTAALAGQKRDFDQIMQKQIVRCILPCRGRLRPARPGRRPRAPEREAPPHPYSPMKLPGKEASASGEYVGGYSPRMKRSDE